MKKILSIILALAVLLSTLTACGGGTTGGDTATAPTPVATPEPAPTPKALSDTVSLSRYDEATKTYINDYTGLELTLNDDWFALNVELALSNTFNSGHTTDEVKAMTSDQLAELDRFTDYCILDVASNTYMVVLVESVPDKISSAEEYEQEISKVFTDIFDKGKVMLSGVEYNYIRGRLPSGAVYFYWLLRDDGRVVQINCYPQKEFSHRYIEALFNGGTDENPDTANVPSLSEFDQWLNRLVNTSTDIELDVLYNWTYATKDGIAETYYNTDGRTLAAMSKEELAEYNIINDMFIAHKYNEDFVLVRYLNLHCRSFYDLSVDEIMQQQINWYDDDTCDVTLEGQVETGGHTYSAVKMYYPDENEFRYLLFRPLNEDYMVEIMRRTDAATDLDEFVSVLNSNNDAEVVLQRSEYDEKTSRFHNESTDIDLVVPADWYRIDQKMLDWQYKGNLTTEQLDNWTDEQYRSAQIVPDFAVASPDNNAYLLVYYVNLNKIVSDRMLDMFTYYNMVVEDREADGYTFNERDIAYELAGNVYMYLDAVDSEGNDRRQYAMCDLGNEYVLVLNYHIKPEYQGTTDLIGILLSSE